MAFWGELRVEAAPSSLGVISFYVYGIGQRLQMTEQDLNDVERAVAEVAGLIVKHAYPEDEPGDLLLQVDVSGDVVRFTFSYWGRSFDPDAPEAGQTSGAKTQSQEARSGLYYSRRFMEVIEQRPAQAPGDPHRLILIKKVESLPPGTYGPGNVRELQAMMTVGMCMASNFELDALLEFIVDEFANTMKAELATLYLIDEEKNELVSRVLMENSGKLAEIRLKIGEGLAGYAAAAGEVLNIRQAYQDPRFAPEFDRITGYRSETMLVMPMRNPQRKIIGVVQMLNKRGGPFSAQDERLLGVMAAQAAIRIENARLYEQEVNQKLITRELETAQKIQASFLPCSLPKFSGFDIAGSCDYCRQTGGDYYDVIVLGSGNSGPFGVVVGDVSGHGISAALLMATARAFLRGRASEPGSPAEIITDVNRQLSADTWETGQFMTLFFCKFEPEHRTIQWVRAGHEPALLYHASTNVFEELKGRGVALGLNEAYEYQQFEHRYHPGDILVFGTDGIWEMRNKAGVMFGKQALKALIRSNASKPADRILTAVSRTLTHFRGDQLPDDDVTMVVVKVVDV